MFYERKNIAILRENYPCVLGAHTKTPSNYSPYPHVTTQPMVVKVGFTHFT